MADKLPSYLTPVTPDLPEYLKPVEQAPIIPPWASTLAQNRKQDPQMLKGLAAGVIQDLIGVANTPHNFINNIPAAFPTQTGEQAVGLQNPSFGARRAEDVGQGIPYLLGEEFLAAKGLIKGASELPALGKLIRNAEVGGAFGATQSDNPYLGGIEGAAINAILPPGIGAVVKGVPKAVRGLMDLRLQKQLPYAKPALEENIAGYVKPEENIGVKLREELFNKGKENYQGAKKENKGLWNQLNQETANTATPFEPKSYHESLTKRINELRSGSEGQEPLETAAADAIGYLQKYMDPNRARLESLQDAVKHGKALNEDFRKEFRPNSNVPMSQSELDAIKYAKGSFKEAVSEQLNKPELEKLKKLWESANQSTQNLKETFEQSISGKGKLGTSTFSRLANIAEGKVDPTGIVREYLPKKGEQGTTRFEQLEKITGDPKLTKQVLMDEIFGKAVTGKHLDAPKFLDRYTELSDKQKDYFFPSTYRKQMDALAELTAREKGKGMKSGFWYHTVPAIIGSLLGKTIGEGWVEGGLVGYGAGKVAEHGLNKFYENPENLSKAVDQILTKEKPGAPRGVSNEVLDYVTKGLPAVTTVPLVNALGGQ